MSQRRRVLFLPAWNVPALHEGVVAYAQEANWVLDNMMSYSGQLPHQKRADGVICRHSSRPDIIEFTRELNVPTVGFEHTDMLPLPRVYYNEELIGQRAARHLLERGYETLAFYHRGWTPFQMERMVGFRAEVEAAGARFILLEPEGASMADVTAPTIEWKWLREALAGLEKPIGVMAINDQLARPLIDALLDFGYDVPEEIAVVSAENDPMLCEIGAIPVSSVETCTWKLGYEAARLLDELMDGAPPPDEPRRIDPGEVATRASSDLVAVPNRHASRALRFIWTHYTEPINVDRVSERVPVTRRRLQTLFHVHVGRTMQEEIARVRTAKACSLLKESRMKIHEIAAAVGFSSSLHLHRTFQSSLQMGPKAFRDNGAAPDFGILPAWKI